MQGQLPVHESLLQSHHMPSVDNTIEKSKRTLEDNSMCAACCIRSGFHDVPMRQGIGKIVPAVVPLCSDSCTNMV